MIGKLKTESDLARFVKKQVERPDVLPKAQPPIALTKAGVPTDADFPQPPGDGLLAVDTSSEGGPTLYIRLGTWQAL